MQRAGERSIRELKRQTLKMQSGKRRKRSCKCSAIRPDDIR
ncbi:MAG: hypothetical protein MR484_09265 [Ruminococcus sp.]|nr:hypothetical protein [Ruminococcus sp.]